VWVRELVRELVPPVSLQSLQDKQVRLVPWAFGGAVSVQRL
jgi:hypothetical protein